MKSLQKLTQFKQEGLNLYSSIDSSIHHQKPVPTIHSMRSVTPDSIQRLKEFSSRGLTERKFTPTFEPKGIRVSVESSSKKIRSSTKQSLIRNIPKDSLSKINSKSVQKAVCYKDFKNLHHGVSEVQKKFIIKNFNIKARIQKIMKMIAEPRVQEPAQPEDSFLINTVYEKPALTFEEKLFRLQQVSIFK